MMQLTITDAGRAALVNAANTGTLPITLDKVVLGSALYSPVATQTALQAPIKTITSFGADAVADDTIHITITDESADEYDLGEIGIYAGNRSSLVLYSILKCCLHLTECVRIACIKGCIRQH